MVVVRNYEELERYAKFFFDGGTQLMILSGMPGIGKSEIIKHHIKKNKDVKLVEGYMTKTAFIRTLYENRDATLVIDDTDNLFADRSLFGVLRVAFDTGETRQVTYASPSYAVADIPPDFTISAPLLIITNGLKESMVMKAFQSRAVCVEFRPTQQALSEKLHKIVEVAANVPQDEEVLELFDAFLPVSKEPNFRAYILSAKLKPQGIDWKSHLAETMKVDPMLSAMVQATHSAKSFKDRAQKFSEITGKSSRTYARVLKEYRGVL